MKKKTVSSNYDYTLTVYDEKVALKKNIFQDVAMSVQLNGCTSWTLKEMEII